MRTVCSSDFQTVGAEDRKARSHGMAAETLQQTRRTNSSNNTATFNAVICGPAGILMTSRLSHRMGFNSLTGR